MELQGKIIAALPQRSGDSKRNPGEKWVSQEFVLETMDSQYPRKMVFDVFGSDRLQRFNIQVGQMVTVSFDIDAREYNGRWFNSIRAFDVRLVDPNAVSQDPAAPFAPEAAPFPPVQPTADPAAPAANPFAAPAVGGESTDDLPF